MTVLINGQASRLDGRTVAEAVATLTRATTGIAVALNGEVVPKGQWGRRLGDGDQVEILTASQGG